MTERTSPRILVFSGSIRTGSWNTKLAEAVANALPAHGATVTLISLADYPMPLFNEDLETDGPPEPACALAKLMSDHDGVMILSPEYNASLPPLLKNTLDWVSRIKDVDGTPVSPYRSPVFAMGGATGGGLATIRNLIALRTVLANGLGALVIAEQLGVPQAHQAFDADGTLVADRPRAMMDAVLTSLVDKAARLAK